MGLFFSDFFIFVCVCVCVCVCVRARVCVFFSDFSEFVPGRR
jgi:hypothetical protein